MTGLAIFIYIKSGITLCAFYCCYYCTIFNFFDTHSIVISGFNISNIAVWAFTAIIFVSCCTFLTKLGLAIIDTVRNRFETNLCIEHFLIACYAFSTRWHNEVWWAYYANFAGTCYDFFLKYQPWLKCILRKLLGWTIIRSACVS